ncbi:MAG: DUF4238 domain-containing protein [Bacteroidota bacterium]
MTAIQQNPERHHFVPRCYLKNFLRNGKFFVLDIEKVKKGFNEYPKKLSDNQVCYIKNYYEINTYEHVINVHDKLFVEKEVLRKLEGLYNKIYNKILLYNDLEINDCITLSDFIIQLKIRNPFFQLKTIEKNKDSWIDDIFQEGFDLPPEFNNIPIDLQQSIFKMIKNEKKKNPYTGREIQLNSLILRHSDDFEKNRKIREAIINCKWTLLVAPDNGPFFITSDNPGVSTGLDGLVYNTKFDNGFYFHFPLSPLHCLLISDDVKDNCFSENSTSKFIQKVIVEPKIVIGTNNKSIQRINKLLIAVDDWYLKQLAVLNKPDKLNV